MRLKSTRNRKVGKKEYRRWLISDVPRETVEELGWGEGEDLEGVPQKGGLLVRRRHK